VAYAENIAVALLAAGRSTRFGDQDKLTSWLGGKMLIEWAASAGLGLPAKWHFLIAGPDAAYDPLALGYNSLINPVPGLGMASSLRIAAAEAERVGASALVVLLADMPFIQPTHLKRIVATFRTDDSRAVFSKAGEGAPQPPALLPAILFPLLQSLEGDKGARSLAAEASIVEIDEDQLLDVDTVADLDHANIQLKGGEA
jgi:molybdenum cofactor cytidylyltransferase